MTRKEYARRWYKKNRTVQRKKHRAYYWANKLRLRGNHSGLKVGEYIDLLKKQKGLCGACGEKAGTKGLVVDHCHKSMKVRKLLCTFCNAALGMAKECPTRLRKLAIYIEFHRSC